MHYDPALELIVAGDASDYGLGVVLSQKMRNGEEQPVAFASRSLSAAEKNYSQAEKETLACIFAVKRFHSYLCGREFTLTTDHKPLLTLLGEHKPISHQEYNVGHSYCQHTSARLRSSHHPHIAMQMD